MQIFYRVVISLDTADNLLTAIIDHIIIVKPYQPAPSPFSYLLIVYFH